MASSTFLLADLKSGGCATIVEARLWKGANVVKSVELTDSSSMSTNVWFLTLDQRTEEVFANIAQGDVEVINRAVKAARKDIDEGP
ncbi:hypothetical protein YC2023_082765 [Brassica napus]